MSRVEHGSIDNIYILLNRVVPVLRSHETLTGVRCPLMHVALGKPHGVNDVEGERVDLCTIRPLGSRLLCSSRWRPSRSRSLARSRALGRGVDSCKCGVDQCLIDLNVHAPFYIPSYGRYIGRIKHISRAETDPHTYLQGFHLSQ